MEETTSIEIINDKQENAMATLREKIQARKALHEAEVAQRTIDPILAPVRVIQDLPEITTPVGEFGEFDYQRFMEVQKRLDVAYGNWLCVFLLQDTGELFTATLKELVQTVDLYVHESLRVRYA